MAGYRKLYLVYGNRIRMLKTLLQGRQQAPVRLILRPGQRGTKKLMEQYGDRFMCVRYRYDALRKKRLKTVEIVIEEIYWKPETYENVVPNIMTGIRIDYLETEIRHRVKEAGGRWNPVQKL